MNTLAPLHDALLTVRAHEPQKCSVCKGSGWSSHDTRCHACIWEGTIPHPLAPLYSSLDSAGREFGVTVPCDGPRPGLRCRTQVVGAGEIDFWKVQNGMSGKCPCNGAGRILRTDMDAAPDGALVGWLGTLLGSVGWRMRGGFIDGSWRYEIQLGEEDDRIMVSGNLQVVGATGPTREAAAVAAVTAAILGTKEVPA